MRYRPLLFACAAVASSAFPATAGTVTFNAILNGGNECIAGPTCLQGDPDAYGVATITMPTKTTICFSILIDNVDPPTAAHIHAGTAAVNGGIIVPLAPPATGNPGASSNCVGTPAGFNASLAKDPASFYVNVHTGAFPNGAMRGQVF